MMNRKAFWALLAVGLTAVSTGIASAQFADRGILPRVGLLGGPQRNSLIGSWEETVTFPPETGRPSTISREVVAEAGWCGSE